MEKVMVNADEIRKDLARMGLQARQVSISMGKHGNYISEILSRADTRTFERKTIELIEKALFREPGAYCIEIKEQETEEKPQGGGVDPTRTQNRSGRTSTTFTPCRRQSIQNFAVYTPT